MIDLYTWPPPNGRKMQIMLEETGLAYDEIPVDISEGEPPAPDYLAFNPDTKVLTGLDGDGPDGAPYAAMETGAILLCLATKTGRFIPKPHAARHEVFQWLMWQIGGPGPTMGQAQIFSAAQYE